MEIDTLENPELYLPDATLPSSLIDITGETYGRYAVVCFAGRFGDRKRPYWLCRCSCGTLKSVLGDNLRYGKIVSCGCYNLELVTRHGRSKHPLYPTYKGMVTRCYNPKANNYPDYGGRGIKVCERWVNSFEDFVLDMGERPDGCTMDRIDNDGNYEPSNCRWATHIEQANNKNNNTILEHDGRKLTICEWSREIGVTPDTICKRIKSGMTIEEVLYSGDMSKYTEVIVGNTVTKEITLYSSIRETSRLTGLHLSGIARRIKTGSKKLYHDCVILPLTDDNSKYVRSLIKGDI